MKAYLILLLAVVLWKGYYVWQRGWNTYCSDRKEHDSLREYLLGNGATPWQSQWPFIRHALVKASKPLLSQWRLWLALLALGIVTWLLTA